MAYGLKASSCDPLTKNNKKRPAWECILFRVQTINIIAIFQTSYTEINPTEHIKSNGSKMKWLNIYRLMYTLLLITDFDVFYMCGMENNDWLIDWLKY